MRSSWFWFVVSLTVATQAWPATVVSLSVVHTIEADDRVNERTELEVRLDREGESGDWSPYSILLDANRTLKEINCSATRPDGTRVKIPKRHQERREIADRGELHSSRELHQVVFPGLPAGSLLRISYEVEVRPYYASGSIPLPRNDSISELRIEVRGGDDRLRWNVEGAAGLLATTSENGSLVVTASDLAAEEDEVDWLRYTWSPRSDWEGVGLWYEQLLAEVDRDSPAIAATATQLLTGVDEPRERLDQLLAFVRRDVRYVAVEVGIGGYQPSPPAEVLERRWGDCKDKSLLLVELLEEAGISAFPAILRLSYSRDIVRSFATPDGFNHMIVAIPEGAVAVTSHDPVAGGYLFVDPTQRHGGAGWLHPGVQRKGALVVQGEQSALVATPDCWSHEGTRLLVELELAADGSASGTAELLLSGSRATALLDQLQSSEAEEGFRRQLSAHLTGARLSELHWGSTDEPVPIVRLKAAAQYVALTQMSRRGPSLRLPGRTVFPESQELADDAYPGLRPGSFSSRWTLRMPSGWCPAEISEVSVMSSAGVFRQSGRVDSEGLVIERLAELRPPGIEPTAAEQLYQLYVAEQRALKRRLRFSCD